MQRAQVSVVRCQNYGPESVRAAMKSTVDNLGGIEHFVTKGDRVFLKLNLLFASLPEKAVTTHPSVIKAAIELLEEAGAKVVAGDSPGGPFTKGRLEKCYRKSGIYEAIEGTGAELNWNLETVRLSNPTGKLMKSIEVMKAVADCDKIISLPKLKTHILTGYTGAVKLMYGVIPGIVKFSYHSKLPDRMEFSDMLLDVLGVANPHLSIMDAVVGMEGQGPSAGNPRKAGAIIASQDPTALDLVACTIAGLDAESVTTLERAKARGLTTGKLEDVEILGDGLDWARDIRFKPAVKQKSAFPIPKFLHDFLANRYTKPVAEGSKCTRCGECARSCPRKCITITKKKAIMDYKKCIRCFCCHELCPESAIKLK